MWIQQRPRGLNIEEAGALTKALSSLALLLTDLKGNGYVNQGNARVSVRELIKTHPTTRSLGVSESDIAKLVSGVQ
jgi:hypothetical protein